LAQAKLLGETLRVSRKNKSKAFVLRTKKQPLGFFFAVAILAQ
jgi:hypothetical protein